LAEHGIVVGNHLQKDFGDDVLDVLRTKGHAAQVAGVVDDVVDQPEVAVNKIIPGSQLMIQAALKQRTIHGGECHVCYPCFGGPGSEKGIVPNAPAPPGTGLFIINILPCFRRLG
jgi:hypothetical protein